MLQPFSSSMRWVQWFAVLFLLPTLCRWPLHTGVSLNFWRDGCAQQKYSQNKLELEFSRLRATYFKSLFLLLAQHVFYSKFPDPICWWKWLFMYFRKELYRTEQLATILGPFWWLCSWLGMFIVNPSWSNFGKCHGYVHYSMSAIGLCLLGCACLGRISMELDTKQPWFLLACSSCSS